MYATPARHGKARAPFWKAHGARDVVLALGVLEEGPERLQALDVPLHVAELQAAARRFRGDGSREDVGHVRNAVVSQQAPHLEALETVRREGRLPDLGGRPGACEAHTQEARVIEEEESFHTHRAAAYRRARCLPEEQQRPKVEQSGPARRADVEHEERSGQCGQRGPNALEEVAQQACFLGSSSRDGLHLQPVGRVQAGGLAVNALRAEPPELGVRALLARRSARNLLEKSLMHGGSR